MNKLVIFDLDGTLLDTLADIYEQMNIALAKFGYPERTYEQMRSFIGNGARKLVERSFGITDQEELEEKLKYYNKIYTECGSTKTALYKGIDKVLINLKERGFKLAILTNKPQISTDEVYKTYLESFNFDMVVGQSGSVKCKPDKTATLNILSELNVLPENTYFVGDGETDIITARNAGVKSIAVTWGYRDKEQLLEAGATVFASTPEQLISLII